MSWSDLDLEGTLGDHDGSRRRAPTARNKRALRCLASGARSVILYEDEELVAIDKPSGLLVHRQAGHPHEVAALQLVRDLVGTHVYPVHRLDRSTSGVVLFAKSPAVAASVSGSMSAGTFKKTYEAIVRGWAPRQASIDYPLVHEERKVEQEARTELSLLGTCELDIPVGRYATARYSRVQLHPLTGRTHQLRRHMAHLRHPIVGDVNHGDGAHNRAFREHFESHRLLLFATELTLPHPRSGKALTIRAEHTADTLVLLERLAFTAAAEL